ncbi:MAG: IPExxxVDY family protein [Bacteroidota bacterium]|jgi:hypothetical protein
MAKKIVLESRTEPSCFTILGISCHLKDYRLSFLLNQNLPADFKKMDDFPGGFSLYFYLDEECRNSFYLLSNRSEEKILFHELKQTDFIMLLDGPVKKARLDRMLKTIRAIPNVLTGFEILVDSLKNFPGFLADLELHLMKIKKDSKPKSILINK